MKKTLFYEYSEENVKKNETLLKYYSKEDFENSYIIEFANNEFIQREGCDVHFLYFILKGKAKIFKNQANGKRIILQFLQEEDFIGDLTVIGAEKTAKDVLSAGGTICAAVPMDYAEKILAENKDFLKLIGRYIGEKLLIRMDSFVNNQTYELKYRLAKVMLSASTDNVYKENHSEIADYLGVSYRHLLHTIKKFKDEKMIYKKGKEYILDREKLEKLIGLKDK